MEYVPELTGLRALAVFLAFSEHAAIPSMQGGWIGVDIFFVLSGYLITSILVGEWRRTDGIRLGRFYAKHALRLYPALILMFALGLIFYRFLGDGERWSDTEKPPSSVRHTPRTSRSASSTTRRAILATPGVWRSKNSSTSFGRPSSSSFSNSGSVPSSGYAVSSPSAGLR